MIEPAEALTWLYSVLSVLSGVTAVYRGVAPASAAYIYVLTAYQGGTDAMEVSGIRLMNSSLYQVKAVGLQAQTTDVKALANSVDVALTRAHGTTATGNILSCVREQAFVMDEVVAEQVPLVNIGGLYRILATSL